MNNSHIIWVHEDSLSPSAPPYLKYPDAAAVFVFDEVWIEEQRYGVKRLAFIYECLLEMPVTILKGDPVSLVTSFAKERGATAIATASTPNPRLKSQIDELKRSFQLEVLETEPFVQPRGNVDLKRFSRYWARVEKLVLQANK